MFINILDGSSSIPKATRDHKGKSLIEIPNDYVLVDIETTGYSTEYDDIIEIGILKIRNNEVVDSYNRLLNPGYEIDDFIVELTGITNDMLKGKPHFSEIAKECYEFISDSIIVGHNVNFDINFLYDNLFENDIILSNNFVDMLRIARKLSPNFNNHKLETIANQLGVEYKGAHRSLSDCNITFECFSKYKNRIKNENIDIIDMFRKIRNGSKNISSDIIGDDTKNNPDSPLYKKYCCFTGTLDKMLRREAMQLVADIGGYCEDNVTQNTNYLILGDLSYSSNVKGEKSNKVKKAEKNILSGKDLLIIPETEFYEMVTFSDEIN